MDAGDGIGVLAHSLPEPADAGRRLVADVKAMLLPLLPLDAALERLVESLPRRWVGSRLVPGQDIETLDESKGEYRATGANPCFDLILDPSARQGGWFYLEAALVRHNGNRKASLQVEVQGDPVQSFVWPVSTNRRGTVREVVQLPPNATRLCWQPTAAPGYFSQSPMLVHRIGSLESFGRRLHRVAHCSQSAMALLRALPDLHSAYRRVSDGGARAAFGNDYPAFLVRAEKRDRQDELDYKRRGTGTAKDPLLSILMVVHAPDAGLLAETIKSVVSQTYPNWELRVAASASVPADVVLWLECQCAADPRIKLSVAADGLDAAQSLNQALGLAQGHHVARLGQHDLLPAHALAHIARELGRHPDAELIYTDEDMLDANGERTNPAFKPDWNPELLTSTHYVSALAVFGKALLRQAGGWRSGFDGAEDFDLLLRIAASQPTLKTRHVCKVLYSRRTVAPADGASAAHEAGLRALQEHLAPQGATASAEPATGCYRVRRPVPEPAPLVSLIIPTRDKVEILRACIESIQQGTSYTNWEMLVVDNDSADEATHEYLMAIGRDCRIKVLRDPRAFNYSRLNNLAARQAQGELLGLLNNDLEVITPDWLAEMVSHAVRPGIGAVGAKLLYPDGTVQHAGVVLGIGGVAGHVHRFLSADETGYCHRASLAQNLSAVTGACMLVRKQLYWEVGGMDEVNLAVAFNDIDFCLKLRDAGYRNLFTPHALLHHHESLSRGRADTIEKSAVLKWEFAYMQKIWREKLLNDPAYNPNLTLQFEDFSFSNRE